MIPKYLLEEFEKSQGSEHSVILSQLFLTLGNNWSLQLLACRVWGWGQSSDGAYGWKRT